MHQLLSPVLDIAITAVNCESYGRAPALSLSLSLCITDSLTPTHLNFCFPLISLTRCQGQMKAVHVTNTAANINHT
jgi:hypothetical protein